MFLPGELKKRIVRTVILAEANNSEQQWGNETMSLVYVPSASSFSSRQPGIFYHATRTSDVASLLANGADASLVGKSAGSVVGVGFYVSHVSYDAEYWADKLFTCATTIVQVRLPTARIATPSEQRALAPQLASGATREGRLWDEAPGDA
jgi:hypothetical protein